MVNKLTFVNTFVLHTFISSITRSANDAVRQKKKWKRVKMEKKPN